MALLLAVMVAQDAKPSGPIEEIDMRIHARPVVSTPPPPPLQEPAPSRIPDPSVPSDRGLIDFDWLEMDARVGVSIFSDIYHIDPSPRVGIELRAPITLIAPADNPDGDYFGIFTQLDVTPIKRTIEPAVDQPSGAMVSLTLGLDYSIFRTPSIMLLVRAGFQYATYGGVTDLNDGIAPLVGLRLGLTLSSKVTITLNPEYVQGDHDSITSACLGLTFDF